MNLVKSIRTHLLIVLGLAVLLAASTAAAATEAPEQSPVTELEQQLFTPEPQQEGGQCIYCDTGYATAVHWGQGANCTASRDDLEDQIYAAAQAACAGSSTGVVCQPNVIITYQCYYNLEHRVWVTDGYLSFGCLEGDFFCPEW